MYVAVLDMFMAYVPKLDDEIRLTGQIAQSHQKVMFRPIPVEFRSLPLKSPEHHCFRYSSKSKNKSTPTPDPTVIDAKATNASSVSSSNNNTASPSTGASSVTGSKAEEPKREKTPEQRALSARSRRRPPSSRSRKEATDQKARSLLGV